MSYVAMVYNPPPDKPKPSVPVPSAEPAGGLPVPGYQPVPETTAAADALPGKLHGSKSKPATMQARYLSGLYDLDELGVQLRRQAAQVGMEQAQQWIALSDAGSGLDWALA